LSRGCQYIRDLPGAAGNYPLRAIAKSGCLAKRPSGRLAGAAVLLDLEVDLLAFDQGGHASPLDGGDVDENVRAAIVGSDEAVTLGGVEPLDGSSCHFFCSFASACVDDRVYPAGCIEILEKDVSKREDREARVNRPEISILRI
jgi:hypothetical protein